MFGVGKYIREQKKKFREARLEKSKIDNVKKQEQIDELKKERIRMEEKARLEDIKMEEIKKIKEARQKTNKVRGFAVGLAKHLNKKKEGGKVDFGFGQSPFK